MNIYLVLTPMQVSGKAVMVYRGCFDREELAQQLLLDIDDAVSIISTRNFLKLPRMGDQGNSGAWSTAIEEGREMFHNAVAQDFEEEDRRKNYEKVLREIRNLP